MNVIFHKHTTSTDAWVLGQRIENSVSIGATSRSEAISSLALLAVNSEERGEFDAALEYRVVLHRLLGQTTQREHVARASEEEVATQRSV